MWSGQTYSTSECLAPCTWQQCVMHADVSCPQSPCPAWRCHALWRHACGGLGLRHHLCPSSASGPTWHRCTPSSRSLSICLRNSSGKTRVRAGAACPLPLALMASGRGKGELHSLLPSALSSCCLVSAGYFPVTIEALPEGTAIHARVPVYQVGNTHSHQRDRLRRANNASCAVVASACPL